MSDDFKVEPDPFFSHFSTFSANGTNERDKRKSEHLEMLFEGNLSDGNVDLLN